MGDTKLRRIDKWAPSQNPYWFDRKSIRPASAGWSMDAIWAGRKNGRTVITIGVYRFFDLSRYADLKSAADASTGLALSDTFELIESADTRYGGNWQYRWDGIYFQHSPELVDLMPAQMGRVLDTLKMIHNDPIKWFDGSVKWVGPYYKVEVE